MQPLPDPDLEEPHQEHIYDDSYREEMLENGEISPEEEGFMNGYDSADEEEEEKKEEEE